MRKVLIILLLTAFIQSCSSDSVYSYIVKNDTSSSIKVVFISDGHNGIGEISREWSTIIPAGTDAYCFEHIAEPENIVDGKMQEITNFKYIKSIEVYSGDKKAKVDYLSYEMGLHNIKATFGANQGAYTILIKEYDF